MVEDHLVDLAGDPPVIRPEVIGIDRQHPVLCIPDIDRGPVRLVRAVREVDIPLRAVDRLDRIVERQSMHIYASVRLDLGELILRIEDQKRAPAFDLDEIDRRPS